MARFRYPKGFQPPALREANERRHQERAQRVERRQQRMRSSFVFPVQTLTGGFYLERFTASDLSSKARSNIGALANVYKNYAEGKVEEAVGGLRVFRNTHKRYFVVNGERFYWVLDEKSLVELARTRQLSDLVFYGENEA